MQSDAITLKSNYITTTTVDFIKCESNNYKKLVDKNIFFNSQEKQTALLLHISKENGFFFTQQQALLQILVATFVNTRP